MKHLVFSFLFFTQIYIVFGQTVELKGEIVSKSEVENIHVINKTAQRFTITDRNGEFKIEAKLNDTIVFSSIQHILKQIVIKELVISTRKVNVILEDHVNELDAVLVGRVLTGDMLLDIKNINPDDVPINFYDLGIPGYTGKIATQNERRLYEAAHFKPSVLMFLGGGIPLNPIINGISGRTKMLKTRVKLETEEALIRSIKARLGKGFLALNPLEDDHIMDFFYFCADDENFLKRCKNETDFNVLIFLKEKYKQYMNNRNIDHK